MGLFGFMKPKSVEDLLDDAMFYSARGQCEEAVKIYRKAAEQGSVEAVFNSGIMYDRLEKKEKALEAYQEAAKKGHELAAVVVACRRELPGAVLRAVTPDELLRLRPLPADPAEFSFVDELQHLTEEQQVHLEAMYAQAQQIEKLREGVTAEEKAFQKRCKEENLPGPYEFGGCGIIYEKEKLLDTAEKWADVELALLGDSDAQNRAAKWIQKLTGAVVTYWWIRSAEQGNRYALEEMMRASRRNDDLKGYRYWEAVREKLDVTQGKFRDQEREHFFQLWQAAYEKAEAQRRRAVAEYPEGAPTEFRFQRETTDIDKAKVKKLFESARHAYKTGKQKDMRFAYQQAASMGDAEAQFRLGRMLMPNGNLESFWDVYTDWAYLKNKKGNPPSPPLHSIWEGVYWLVKSARQGNYKACWEMFRLCSESVLSLSPDVSDMIYWMILAVRAEFEQPLGPVNDEEEFFRPYSSGRLRARYSAVRESAKKQALGVGTELPDFTHWEIDPLGEALYRVGLFYEQDSRYDLAVPLHLQAVKLNSGMAQAHLRNLRKKVWYDDAAGTVDMPNVDGDVPKKELLLAYARSGDLDAAMCLSDIRCLGDDYEYAWKEVVTQAASAASDRDPVCDYLDDVFQNRFSGTGHTSPYHVFFLARKIMSDVIMEEQIKDFQEYDSRLFLCGMDMKCFRGVVRRAREVIEESARERAREIAMEELEEQLEEQQEKIAAYNREMSSYVDNLVTWRKADDYGEYGIYAKQSVLDQIDKKRRQLKDEYGL